MIELTSKRDGLELAKQAIDEKLGEIDVELSTISIDTPDVISSEKPITTGYIYDVEFPVHPEFDRLVLEAE
jgi:hypothetical protein